jgi:Kef-type K+ transport system membrane component KefB
MLTRLLLIPTICLRLTILNFSRQRPLTQMNVGKLITDITTITPPKAIADLGVVLFLCFEMGIHLDFKTLMDMRMDVLD